MMRSALLRWLVAALVAVPVAQGWARPAYRAASVVSIPEPSAQCRAAILAAERATGVPDRLLDAIAVVESGRRDPVSGAVYPWPWTINVEGVGHIYASKAEAIAAVQTFQAQGARSIDVGCMQVNLLAHPGAFASLEQAFDPAINANYGAHFLMQLYGQTSAWPRAVAAYHSLTPEIGADYARKVLAAWGVPLPPVGSQPVTVAQVSIPQVLGAHASGATGVSDIPHDSPFARPPGRVAVLLPSGNEAIRVLPLAGGGTVGSSGGLTSRGLDAYRAAPVALAAARARGF